MPLLDAWSLPVCSTVLCARCVRAARRSIRLYASVFQKQNRFFHKTFFNRNIKIIDNATHFLQLCIRSCYMQIDCRPPPLPLYYAGVRRRRRPTLAPPPFVARACNRASAPPVSASAASAGNNRKPRVPAAHANG